MLIVMFSVCIIVVEHSSCKFPKIVRTHSSAQNKFRTQTEFLPFIQLLFLHIRIPLPIFVLITSLISLQYHTRTLFRLNITNSFCLYLESLFDIQVLFSLLRSLFAFPLTCVHHSPFTVQAFTVHRLAFTVQRSAFTVHRSTFTVQLSAFSVQRSVLSVSLQRL